MEGVRVRGSGFRVQGSGVAAYQLAFRMLGISPRSASLRRTIRLMPNLRYTPRDRPVIWQRFLFRVENFGSFFIVTKTRLLAMVVILKCDD